MGILIEICFFIQLSLFEMVAQFALYIGIRGYSCNHCVIEAECWSQNLLFHQIISQTFCGSGVCFEWLCTTDDPWLLVDDFEMLNCYQ